MAQLTGPIAFWTVANQLVTGIYADLVGTLGATPERACVVPGTIAWDSCDCGMLAVSLNRVFLSETFPQGGLGADARTTPCEFPWRVGEFTIQLIRCAPQPIGNALAPTCEKLSNAAKILTSDAHITLTTTLRLLCELKDTDQIIDFSLGEQTSQGPEGACVGTELSAFVALVR